MLILNKNIQIPLYMQIYTQLKDQITSEKLQEGSMLPSTRALAKNMQVSRNTVESAYQQLCSEGYISSKVGSGYRIEKIESKLYHRLIGSSQNDELSTEPVQTAFMQDFPAQTTYNFQYGRLCISDFPLRTWRKLLNQALLSTNIHHLSAYNQRPGELNLRLEIMKYLYDFRGVTCNPDQIIISSGTLPCLSFICQLLLKDTREIAVEEPCYDSVRSIFINHGFQVTPILVGEDGILLGELKKTCAKAVYVTPSHQFPTGAVMPINQRLSLLAWAKENQAYIIEDDYDSEFRYNSRPIPSMQSLDPQGCVIYMNTFSKSFAPGLRISFMVLPPSLLEKYQTFFSLYHCNVPWLEQKVLHDFMQQGHWNRHLRKICLVNKKKHDTLMQSITQTMGDQVRIYGKNAGLHILLKVRNGMCEKELIERAKEANVTVYPVSNFWSNPKNYSNDMVLIGFSSLSESEISQGIQRLADTWF